MRGLFLMALAGGGYWAWQNGHLNTLFPELMAQQVEAAPDPVSLTEPKPEPKPEPAKAVTPQGVVSAPQTGLGSVTNEYNLLSANLEVVQPWASRNLVWVACLMEQESGGRVNITGPKTKYGYAYGSLQVLLTTAEEIYRDGFTRYQPTKATLLSEKGGIYFGTAYLEMLSRRGRDKTWMAMAYHGGPNGEGTAHWGPKTQAYAKNINAKFLKVTGGV